MGEVEGPGRSLFEADRLAELDSSEYRPGRFALRMPIQKRHPQRRVLESDQARFATVLLDLGDLLSEQTALGVIPPRAIHTIQLLTSSTRLLQGNLAAIPAAVGVLGQLTGERSLLKGANLAGAVVSIIASRAALLNAATSMASVVPGVGLMLGVANLFHAILSWHDDEEDEQQEAIEAFLGDLQQATGELGEGFHQRMVQELEAFSHHAAELVRGQQRVASLVNRVQQEATALHAVCVQQSTQLHEREAEAISQLKVAALDLRAESNSYGHRLAAVAAGVQRLMQEVHESTHALERRIWETPLQNLELFEVRTPKRALRPKELVSGIEALRCALACPLEQRDLLRVGAAALQLRIRAHRAELPLRPLEPVLRQCRDRLHAALQLSSMEQPLASRDAWAQELLQLLSLSEIPEEPVHE